MRLKRITPVFRKICQTLLVLLVLFGTLNVLPQQRVQAAGEIPDFENTGTSYYVGTNGTWYMLSFTIPLDIADYTTLTLIDKFDDSSLSYNDSDLYVFDGDTFLTHSITPSIDDFSVTDEISFEFDTSELEDYAGLVLFLYIYFDVATGTVGHIENTATVLLDSDKVNEATAVVVEAISFYADAEDLYIAGSFLEYTLSITIPPDMTKYETLTLTDYYHPLLSYEDYTFGVGTPATTIPVSENHGMGAVSFEFNAEDLEDFEGDELILVITYSVAGDASGYIGNSTVVFLDGFEAGVTGWTWEEAITDFKKSAGSYTAGYTLDFTVSFTIPSDLSDYEWFYIYDYYGSSSPLSYALGSYVLKINGENAGVTVDEYDYGTSLEFRIDTEDLEGYEGGLLELVITFNVAAGTTGIIENGAQIRYGESVVVGDYDEFVVEYIPDFEKSAEGAYEAGFTYDYILSFTIPSDMTAYDTLTITDIYPDSLSYAGIVALTIDGDVAGVDIPLISIDVIPGTGEVSFEFDASDLVSYEGKILELEIIFDVALDAPNTVTNMAKVFLDDILSSECETKSYSLSVSYDGNGATDGTVPTDDDVYDANDTVKVFGQGTLARYGYTFLGWSTNPLATVAIYSEDDTFTIGDDDVTLYAVWELGEFTITYDKNGGEGNMLADTATYSAYFQLSANTYYRSGYVFTGWNTAADGSGVDYPDEYEFLQWDMEDLTLYAQWQLGKFSVTYMPNGGLGDQMPNGTATYSANFQLARNTYVNAGYFFIGWATNPNGSGVFYPEGYQFQPWNLTSDLTLYAQWQLVVTVTVTFDKNTTGETAGPSPVSKPALTGSAYGTLASISRNGYTFGGWYTDSACTAGNEVTAATIVTTNGDHTLYAKWTANANISYVVHYYLVGTTTTVAPDKAVNNQTMGTSITENAITITGYTAVAPTSITRALAASGNEFIFYYTRNTVVTPVYSVTVRDSYAAITGAGNAYVSGVTVTINAGVRDGVNFTGWTVTSGGVTLANSGNNSTTFTMPAGDVIITANWTEPPTPFKVTVDGSHASVTGAGTYTPGVDVTIDAGTNEGYKFSGWTVVSGGVTLANSGNTTATFAMPAGDVVITANWETALSWSWVNLILCIVGALVALFALVIVLIRKSWKAGLIWLALAVIAGIVGVVVFFLTQNISGTVKAVDLWAIVNAVILLLGLLGAVFVSKSKATADR